MPSHPDTSSAMNIATATGTRSGTVLTTVTVTATETATVSFNWQLSTARLLTFSSAPFAIFLATAVGCAQAQSTSQPSQARGGIDVVELTASSAAEQMQAGTLTSRALTQAYLDRIAAIDDDGPRLNAVIESNPEAVPQA